MFRRAWLLVGVGVLTGCVSLAPDYREPALPVAARYPDATVSNGKTVSNTPSVSNNIDAASTGWRDYFTDPQLQRLIAQALEQNRDLRVAAARVEEARAAYGIQRADLFPGTPPIP